MKFSVGKVTERRKTGIVKGLLKRSKKKPKVKIRRGLGKITRKVAKKKGK